MSWNINVAGSVPFVRARVEAEQGMPPAIKQGLLSQLTFETPVGKGVHLDTIGHIERTVGSAIAESRDEYKYGEAKISIRVIDFEPTKTP